MRGVQHGIVSLAANWKHMIANDFYRGDELFRGAEIGPWARVYGGDNSYKKATTNINGSFWGAEFGYDTDFKDWVVGTSVQYYDGKGTYLSTDKNEYSFYSFNVYGIKKFKNNAQLDVIVKVGNLSNKIYAYNEMGQKIESDYDTMGYALNTKYSVAFEKDQGKYIRPQIQLLLTNVRDVDFTGQLGDMVMDVKQGSFNSLTGIAGIEFGRRSPSGVIYARLDLAHDFAGDVDVTYSAPDGGIKKMKSNLDDTWLRVIVGGDYKVNDRVAVGIDLNRTLNGDYKQKWQANAKIQYRF